MGRIKVVNGGEKAILALTVKAATGGMSVTAGDRGFRRRYLPWVLVRRRGAPAPAAQDVSNRYRPFLIISKPFACPYFKRLAARFCATPTSFPEQLDQSHHLLIFLESKSLLEPAKPPIDSLHRLFGDGIAGRSTLSDMEPVTTFSGETNCSSMANGSLVVLVGMMLVSNRSNRRERPLLFIVVCHKSRAVGPGLVQALPARSALAPFPQGSAFPADRKRRTASLVAGDPPSAIRAGELCAVSSHPAATFPEPSIASAVADASIRSHTSSRPADFGHWGLSIDGRPARVDHQPKRGIVATQDPSASEYSIGSPLCE